MKKILFWGVIAPAFLASQLTAASRTAQWQAVDEAVAKGLPQTAVTELEEILTGAIAEQSYAEAVKALGRKIALEGTIQGNKPEEKIVRLQAAIDNVPAAMRPTLEAILAHWYWQFFQHNRWRFLQRTQTAESPGPDILTWDLTRILTEIDRHFTAALTDEAGLRAIPVSTFNDLLERGSVPDTYRPTLFDVLVHEALQFYQAGEQGAISAEDAFELDAAASPIFAPVGEFVDWAPTVVDGYSSARRAVELYQKLLRFHETDRDQSAFYDADLARLQFGRNAAVGDDKEAHFQVALERFATATQHHEIHSRAMAALAAHVNEHGDAVQARVFAQRGLDAFPESVGAAMCYNLIQQIEAKSAQVATERVWNAPWPTLDVTYRNVAEVHFRAFRMNYEDLVKADEWNLEEEDLQALFKNRPALEWSADLSPTDDFQERTEHVPAPDSLRPGYYFIVASYERDFRTEGNEISVCPVWVSELALVVRTRNDGEPNSGLVLDARRGTPIAGAQVRIWHRNRNYDYRSVAPLTTDADGRFEFPNYESEILLLAEHDGQAISCNDEIHTYGIRDDDAERRQTIFFTDRAIYRPGQTIHYKGIAVRYRQGAGSYRASSGYDVTVVFNDPNGKEIARAVHRTNDQGSFAGVFTAPRDRLMGQMWIRESGGSGQAFVRVEEYKRPKFQVELPAPVEAAKLEAPVQITGQATAYSGAAIGGAQVKWRVERGVQLPFWCWWWQPPASKAVAHGTTTTAADGTFSVAFTATPDRSVPVKNEPVFVYTIHADVTDTNGETRSADRAVRAGYTALQASVGALEWQTADTPVEFTVETASLDGEPQAARGTVTIHALVQPDTVVRAPLRYEHFWWEGDDEPPADPANPVSWKDGAIVSERTFATESAGKTTLTVALPAGIYRASLATRDRFGQAVTARSIVEVVAPAERRYDVKLPTHFAASQWSVEPGEKFSALWGTGYDTGRALVELECNGRLLRRFWTPARRTQSLIEQNVTEKMRGGFTIRLTYVRENRAYVQERVVDVPWSNQKLTLKWERFRSKLEPGQKETWTAIVSGPDAERVSAEMVAGLYDASLDQFVPHQWSSDFGIFRREWSRTRSQFQNLKLDFWHAAGYWHSATRNVDWRYRSLPAEIVANLRGFGWMGVETREFLAASPPGGADEETVVLSPFEVSAEESGGYTAVQTLAGTRLQTEVKEAPSAAGVVSDGTGKPDLSRIAARRNLNETAFFFPHLRTGADGEVKLEFTMPEGLTEWKFLGFAHDQQLRSGFLTDRIVTAKDLMVEPNPPRFVREGDAIEFTVKVSNQSDEPQRGTVRLTFADAATLVAMDDALGNQATEQAFDVPAKQSRTYAWRIAVPDGLGFLTYKAVGATATLSDGEEGFLPVLSRRILVTESLPLPIRGPATKEFEFAKLLSSGGSDSLRHQSLTVQMVSQPAWYAVMALPYLMEYPYACSEQIFNRYYANTLARHIATSDPKIRRVFDLWKDTPALDSPLEKNDNLKSVMLEETPWLREAQDESQARRNVGLLFDANRLDAETAATLRKLSEQQLDDGLWPWFPGGPPSEFISLYITMGFGRLRHLGAEVDVAPAVRALAALDAGMTRRYRDIQRGPNPDGYVPGHTDVVYLYARSFFLRDQPVADEHRAAVDFFLKQARTFWLRMDCRMCHAQAAIALQRFGDTQTPQDIMRSLRERSVTNEEMGMFWRDLELSWWWYRAPIETQAMMIEAFAEVAQDEQAVEDCKVWLLKQKQTQDWKTTKATADAVYALLLRGQNLLASDALVEVSLGGAVINPEHVEAGTGFYEQKFGRGEIKPAMGGITVRKVDEGVSWGSVHWQYLEDVSKITPHEDTPLRLKKTLFVKETMGQGQVLRPVTGPLAVGDELVVRLELRTDRDMEFVHLKDQRGSGTEPVNVLSRYRYQDGLGYYESTRDTASHFFIDYLPKGTYVFEYSTRVQLKGAYQSGIAEIQCMYAPEFNSHSESFTLAVE